MIARAEWFRWTFGLGFVVLLGMNACSEDGYDNPAASGNREFASGDLTGNGASFTHVFSTAKAVPYYCRYHGGPGGVGMSGTITVTPPGAYDVPVQHSVNITTSTLPNLSIHVGDTITWTNSSGMTHTVESDN